MRFRPLTTEESAATGGATHRMDFSYKDIPAGIANNTALVLNTVALGVPAIPAAAIMKRVQLHLVTPFENTADAAFNNNTVSVGDGGSATRFINASQVNVNGTEVIDVFPGASENFIYTAADQLAFTLNSMAGKSISNLNKGQLYILFWLDRAGSAQRARAGGGI